MLGTFFEITPDDFQVVASAHGVKLSDDRVDELAVLDAETEARLLKGTENLLSLDDQTQAVYGEIEQHLMEQGVIPKGDRKFVLGHPDDDNFPDEEFDEDDDDDDEFDDDDDLDDDELDDEDDPDDDF